MPVSSRRTVYVAEEPHLISAVQLVSVSSVVSVLDAYSLPQSLPVHGAPSSQARRQDHGIARDRIGLIEAPGGIGGGRVARQHVRIARSIGINLV